MLQQESETRYSLGRRLFCMALMKKGFRPRRRISRRAEVWCYKHQTGISLTMPLCRWTVFL
ncbi:hypothetical protein DPMN_079294 [Dreissena polymorpha]|uniref:Uncharacterized protein n=1 Tax=Dreissena polymorpha TaxID=45954 RepID=A0A9D4BQY1_DREPO|nr:hypothetical protein DPMN_079294 [Dreissena polymorpha]